MQPRRFGDHGVRLGRRRTRAHHLGHTFPRLPAPRPGRRLRAPTSAQRSKRVGAAGRRRLAIRKNVHRRPVAGVERRRPRIGALWTGAANARLTRPKANRHEVPWSRRLRGQRRGGAGFLETRERAIEFGKRRDSALLEPAEEFGALPRIERSLRSSPAARRTTL